MPNTDPNNILWPALLHQQGCDELQVLRNQADWEQFSQLSSHLLQPADTLIDSGLTSFTLSDNRQWHPSAIVSPTQLTLLLRAHLAAEGHCCLAKLQLNSIDDAIALITHLDS